MRNKQPTTWLDYLQHVSSNIFLSEDKKAEFVEHIISLNKGFLSLFYHSVPMVYLLDYTTGKYLTMSQSAEKVLGFHSKKFTDGGIGFTIDIYEKDHLNVFNSEIFPDRLHLLKKNTTGRALQLPVHVQPLHKKL